MTASTTNLLSTRPTVMLVDRAALRSNLHRIKNHVGNARVMAVVKANAYGHGLTECGVLFQSAGADFLGCAYLEEGLMLRQAGVTIPILVFGGILADQVEQYIIRDLDITASSLSKLEQIELTAATLKRRARVHLKIDTGMERLGVHYYSSEALLNRVLSLAWCDVVGVFSHFARAEEQDQSFTKLQLERFLECTEFFQRHSLPPPLRHIANSAGLINLPASHLDLVRPGIALYGVMPDAQVPNAPGLEPAMSLTSRVVYFKVVKQGNGVSYGHRWHAPEDTRVVTVPIGYGDGYTRALSNSCEVLIRGNRYRGVGAICMDQMMVNIGAGESYNGDEVVLIGRQGSESISVSELAANCNSIPYEILVSMNERIPRIYHG